MKKIFFTICFSFLFFITFNCSADLIPLEDYEAQSQLRQLNTPAQGKIKMPDPNNQEEVRAFFKKRFETAMRSVAGEKEKLGSQTAVSVIHTPEYYEAQKENEKSLFERMYDQVVKTLQDKNDNPEDNNKEVDPIEQELATAATRFFTLAQPEEQSRRETLPTVSVTLPSGRKILAPAHEHIAYFLSYIDIQANGYIKIEDTITVVANNQRLAWGLDRTFAKNATQNQKIDFTLEKVTINDTVVPYITEEIGNNIMLTPKYNHKLEPGVYTYKFNYIVNNKLEKRDNRWLLNWSLTGRPMNLFITSANAIVSLPTGHSFDDITAVVGSKSRYTNRRTNSFKLAGNVMAFSNYTPLFQGEDMHIVAVMNKNVFFKNFDKNFSNFITNWGNILYAALGLAAILLSFILSLLNLKHERKNKKYTPSYNGALMRSIIVGKYDRLAFVAQILDLFRKNALDILHDNGRIFLQKKSAESNKLTAVERKGLKQFFKKKNNTLEIKNANTLILKKAKKIFEKATLKQIKKYRLIHNISYVLFSIAMLVLTEIFIAYISVNFAQTFIILLATTLMYAFYIWILRHKFKKWYVNVPLKILILLAMFIIWLFSSVYIGGICSFIVMLMIAVIFAFTRIFGEYNNFINEAKDAISNYKEYLTSNADALNLSSSFVNQQSNVFALEIEEYFPQNITNKNRYRLDVAEVMKQLLIGIV